MTDSLVTVHSIHSLVKLLSPKLLSYQTTVSSNEWLLMWMSTQVTVSSENCLLKWLSSQVTASSNYCLLMWFSPKVTAPQITVSSSDCFLHELCPHKNVSQIILPSKNCHFKWPFPQVTASSSDCQPKMAVFLGDLLLNCLSPKWLNPQWLCTQFTVSSNCCLQNGCLITQLSPLMSGFSNGYLLIRLFPQVTDSSSDSHQLEVYSSDCSSSYGLFKWMSPLRSVSSWKSPSIDLPSMTVFSS